MFEFFNVTKEGQGIRKDAPQKQGLSLFIDILSREFGTIIMLNILFIVCSLPIFTIGASYAGMHSVIIKILRDKPVFVISDFKKGFKENFKQGTITYIIFTFIASIFCLSYIYYSVNFVFLSYVMLSIIFISIMVSTYVYPLIVGVTLDLKHIYKNAINLSVICFPRSLVAGIFLVIYYSFTLLLFPISIIWSIFLGVSMPCFVSSFFIYHGIKEYVEK